MSTDIAASLNEHQRDALLAYYLGQYVPNSSNTDLTTLVQTPEDVYEYLLIDPLVSNAVPTSQVAQAMSSIQQYINGIALNMEPGYDTQYLDPDHLTQWKAGASQYDVWGGEVELDIYPEDYIDPTLRQNKTEYFIELESSLDQHAINKDNAQQAVLAYLNEFEQVANLDVISGYLDGDDQTRDTYYMLGRTRETPYQYYWRSFDMNEDADNVMSNSAWSQWYAMNTAINDDALMGLPRLAYFNNRLYLFWFEKTSSGKDVDISGTSSSTVTTTSTSYQAISAYSSYCDFSMKWSAPNLLARIDSADIKPDTKISPPYPLPPDQPDQQALYCKSLFDALPDSLYTAALYYTTDDKLLLSLYSNVTTTDPSTKGGSNNSNGIYGYSDFSLEIDYWFNVTLIQSASNDADLTIIAYALDNFVGGTTSPQSISRQQLIQSACSEVGWNIWEVGTPTVCDPTGDYTMPRLSVNNVVTNSDSTLTVTIDIPADFDSSKFHGYSITNIPVLPGYPSSSQSLSTTMPISPGAAEPQDYGGSDSSSQLFNTTILLTQKTVEFPDFTITNVESKYQTLTSLSVYTGPYLLDIFPYHFNYPIENGTVTFDLLIMTSPGESAKFDNDLSMSIGYDGTANYIIFDFAPKDYPLIHNTWSFRYGIGDWADITGSLDQSSFAPNQTPIQVSIDVPISSDNTVNIDFTYGYEWNNTTVCFYATYPLTFREFGNFRDTPYIATCTDATLGTAQYLDFGDATFNDGKEIAPVRLNTLFAKTLIGQASVSLDSLLNWNTQLTMEPGLGSGSPPPVPMDFNGANGIYFWELFFYMPHLVAYRLGQEQQYSDAQSWYHYIFDPAARGRTSSNDDYPEPDYWSVRPLVETPAAGAQGTVSQLTTDPDAIASADPVHYQKAIFMAYVSNLIASADASYRLLTNDGLSLAKLGYAQAKDLLGPRPDVHIYSDWTPQTLSALADGVYQNPALRTFEQSSPTDLPLFPGRYALTQTVGTNAAFIAPLNAQLLQYWNLIDSRLYNLRHNLSIDGLPITVPLYAAPINPSVLMAQSVQGGSLTSAANGVVATIPPYRFRAMWQSASSAVGFLSQLGQTLLGYCERDDAAALQELDQQQLLTISSFTISLQQNAIDALAKDYDALTTSNTLTQARRDYYQSLYNNGISAQEQSALDTMATMAALLDAAAGVVVAGSAMNCAPNIFGFSDGGSVWGAALQGAAKSSEVSVTALGADTQRIQSSAEYDRRQDEWSFQASQAQDEMDMISQQLEALSVRQQGAQTALAQAQAQQANLQSTLNFLTSRFTQSSLYNWLTGQLSSLYYQAYDAVLSLCLSTQACWQYEMGDVTTRFIQTNAWSDSYRGFLVGETLQLNLQQMQSAWLSRNVRRLELTKTIALKQLINDDTTWGNFISSGNVDFTLDEALFDADYPGHYLRQLSLVTVTLPTLLGPYQDVRVTLTQTSSSVLLKADIEGVKYLRDATTGNANNLTVNPRANQQVAISSGLNDSGLFSLSFGDERYLPFEGTGAVSKWHLSFPNPTSDEQTALRASLNDVILQVHYTALYGGASFESAVAALT